MNRTTSFSGWLAVGALLLGSCLIGCSDGNKADFEHMTKAQQIEAMNKPDARTLAWQKSMAAKMAQMQHTK